MLNFEKIRKLILGLEEFERTRIDKRLKIIYEEIITNNSELKIESYKNFDQLDETIFRLKELLRIRSSNLNRILRKSNSKIKKNQILELLKRLEKTRKEFIIQLLKNDENNNNTNKNLIENKNEELIDTSQKEYLKTKDEKNINIIQEDKFQIEIFKKLRDSFKIEINRNLNEKESFTIIKKIMEKLTELVKNFNYNIIIKDNNKQIEIYFRKKEDNLISFKQKPTEQNRLKKIYETLRFKIGTIKEKYRETTEEQKKTKDEKIFEKHKIGYKKKKTEEKYLEINEKIVSLKNILMQTEPENNKKKRKEITSLDELIFEKDKDKTFIKENNSDKIIFEKDEPIQIITKTEKSNQETEFETELEKKNQINKTKKEEIEKNKKKTEIEEIKILKNKSEQKINRNKRIEEEIKKKEEKKRTTQKETEQKENKKEENWIVYQDKEIYVKLNEKAKILGELQIYHRTRKKLKELQENSFIYLCMFAKIFSVLIFNILKAEGTNIIYNLEENKIRIIPRFKDDQIKKDLTWNHQRYETKEFEEIKNKLIQSMHKEIIEEKKTDEKEEQKIKNKKNNEINKKEKAEYLLTKITRLP